MTSRPPSRRRENEMRNAGTLIVDPGPSGAALEEIDIEELMRELAKIEMLSNSQYEYTCRSIERLESLVSNRSTIEAQITSSKQRQSELRKEYSKIESDLCRTQNELDSTARDQKSEPNDLDIDTAVAKLEDRICLNRKRLMHSLTELLILTDGEFI
jgi:hypothetical protein